jgi:hypothetical protein
VASAPSMAVNWSALNTIEMRFCDIRQSPFAGKKVARPR